MKFQSNLRTYRSFEGARGASATTAMDRQKKRKKSPRARYGGGAAVIIRAEMRWERFPADPSGKSRFKFLSVARPPELARGW